MTSNVAMRIVFQTPAEGDTIAWEEMLGAREGRFSLSGCGNVNYRHPSDNRSWMAGTNEGQFRDAVDAWNERCEAVVAAPTEGEKEAIDKRLSSELERIGASCGSWYWGLLLEQVQNGLL